MKKIKKKDTVIVITGKYKGVIGDVINVFPDDKVTVTGVAIKKKHVKANPSKNTLGSIIQKNGPIHISNIAIYNPETKQADKIEIKTENNLKQRFYKSNQKKVLEKV